MDGLKALPEAAAFGRIETEALFALDSKDITPAHWLVLTRKLRERLADPAIAGIVVTHGTDTLEETAFFLAQTLPRTKPVVLTAAMRPATGGTKETEPGTDRRALSFGGCAFSRELGPGGAAS